MRRGERQTMLLVEIAHGQMAQYRHPNLGRLVQPRCMGRIEDTAHDGWTWAADNDCYQGLNREAFVRMLDRLEGLPGCKFVAVPDVLRCGICHKTLDGYGGGGRCRHKRRREKIGDAKLTLRRFREWQPELAKRKLPAALVAQDGLRPSQVPWNDIKALFIGGSDEFKLGPQAARLAREAHRRGKWVHWGRVSSRKRYDYIRSTHAADSFDGSKFARWSKAHLDDGLSWTNGHKPTHLPAVLDAPIEAVRYTERLLRKAA